MDFLFRDARLDAVVTDSIYEDRAMAQGPSAAVSTLYLQQQDGTLQPSETKRHSDDNDPSSEPFGFFLNYEGVQVKPSTWRSEWFTGNIQDPKKIKFAVHSILPGQFSLEDVDLYSLRIDGTIKPELVKLQNGPWGIDLTYRIEDLRAYANRYWLNLGQQTGEVCFTIHSNIRDTPIIVGSFVCMAVEQ